MAGDEIWLDVIWRGRLVEINGKGTIRAKQDRCIYCGRTDKQFDWTSQGEPICSICLGGIGE